MDKKRTRIRLNIQQAEAVLKSGDILLTPSKVKYLAGTDLNKVTTIRNIDADYINGGQAYYNKTAHEVRSVKLSSKAPQNAVRKADKMPDIFRQQIAGHRAGIVNTAKVDWHRLPSRQKKKLGGLTEFTELQLAKAGY